MRLDFTQKQVEPLEVIKPDGSVLKLLPVRLTMGNAAEYERKEQILRNDLEAKKINNSEYVLGILGLMIKDFNPESVKDFSMEEITEIMSALGEMRKPPARSENEKKTA